MGKKSKRPVEPASAVDIEDEHHKKYMNDILPDDDESDIEVEDDISESSNDEEESDDEFEQMESSSDENSDIDNSDEEDEKSEDEVKDGTSSEEDDDEEEEEEDTTTGNWGHDKKTFYNANMRLSKTRGMTEEERKAAEEEEEEALRLQKRRKKRIDEDDYDEETKELIESMGKQKEKIPTGKTKQDRSMLKELNEELNELEKSSSKNVDQELSRKEKAKLVMRDAPELPELLLDLKKTIKELREQVQPIIQKVKSDDLKLKQGMKYLNVKYNLMLQYCMHLNFYMLMKAEGQQVQDHPVVDRLVEIRTILERCKPLDARLKYQIDKLLRMAATKTVDVEQKEEDPLHYKPNPENMIRKLDSQKHKTKDKNEEESEVYVPPKMIANSFEQQEKREKKKKQRQERNLRSLMNDEVMQEMQDTVEGNAEQSYNVGAEHRFGKSKAARFAEEIREFEESNLRRLRLSKKQQKLLEEGKQKLVDELDELGQFTNLRTFDRLRQLDEDQQEDHDNPSSVALDHHINEIEKSKAKPKAPSQSGDADVSVKRRDKKKEKELKKLRKQQREEERKRRQEEIKENKKRKRQEAEQEEQERKKRRLRRESEAKQIEEQELVDADKRSASKKILNNRGLVPHKNKVNRAPRAHKKKKFKQAAQKPESGKGKIKQSGNGGRINKKLVRSTQL